jgi:thiol-disulfide isomerase/thioredoxin
MPFRALALAASGILFFHVSSVGYTDDLTPADPYWTLVHDQAVISDLKLTPAQRDSWRSVLDPLDLRSFPLRNKSATEAAEGFRKAAADARSQLAKVLRPPQAQRLEQIIIRAQGTDALLRDDLATKLKLTERQRGDIRQAIVQTRDARAKLQQELLAGKLESAKADQEANRLSTAARDSINSLLTDEQKVRLGPLVARDFDVAKLGNTSFKTPDLIGASDAWLNSPPLDSAALRGRVVVVHFFAFGCINCIHNYPTYRQWQTDFAGKDVQLIGIHTPETMAERNVETLKAKLKAEQLNFPVLIDNGKSNWDAWGNSMWPSVYVLDKQGYMRAFWPGELRWQGATGDVQMRQKIEALLSEE